MHAVIGLKFCIGVSYLLELTCMHAMMVNSGLRSHADFKVLLETNKGHIGSYIAIDGELLNFLCLHAVIMQAYAWEDLAVCNYYACITDHA